MTGVERRSPAVTAAQRCRAPGPSTSVASKRFYPAVAAVEDHEALAAVLSATRALLTAARPEQVAGILRTLVHDLGGGLVPARLADHNALQIDLALGFGEPLLPWAEPVSLAAMRLSGVLPGFREDALVVLDRLRGEQQRTEEAETDVLTGLLSRRAWMRRLGSAEPGDALCLIDLDHFKAVNDRAGHAAGDEVLRAVGALLLRMFRFPDACGRYGGDELVCLAPQMAVAAMVDRVEATRLAWVQARSIAGASVGLSVGVSAVGPPGGRAALHAADAALYRAKAAGRDRTEISVGDPDRRTS